MLDLHKRKWLQDEGLLKVSKSGIEGTQMNSIFVKFVQFDAKKPEQAS